MNAEHPGPAAEPASLSIRPVPSEEEAVAIAAAAQALLFSGSAAAPSEQVPSRWRFSGRWWSKPVPLRRVRPG